MNTDNRPPPYSMRLDPDLRAKLEDAAKAAGRSLHAEISMRLEQSLQMDMEQTMNTDFDERIRQIAREVFEEMQGKAPNKKKP